MSTFEKQRPSNEAQQKIDVFEVTVLCIVGGVETEHYVNICHGLTFVVQAINYATVPTIHLIRSK